MSDHKLRELERDWKAEQAPGEGTVAYLRELLRAGEVTHNECVLAWRLSRIETLLSGHRGAVIPLGSRRLNLEAPSMAWDVLRVLFGQARELSNLHLVGDTGPEGAGVSVGALGDMVRSILMGEGVIQNPLSPYDPAFGGRPLGVNPALQPRCRPGSHLGPINYSDARAPFCERCRQPTPRRVISGCGLGLHDGPTEESTAGTVCTACGEVIVPVGSRP